MAVVGNLAGNPTAAQAFTRFGFGGRPDDAIPADPVAWLMAQITCADQAPPPGNGTLQNVLSLVHAIAASPLDSPQRGTLEKQLNDGSLAEVQSYLTYATTTKIPFRERLVWFWSNHFAVMSGQSSATRALAPIYVRDAIRPHMTGTIADMLAAAILHPAMIWSLNASVSVGPLSQKAIDAAKHGVHLDINENLGRETLELYTVGINANYGQADVDAMAYLLTGADVNTAPGAPLGYFYSTFKQQPGNFTLLGTTFPGTQAGLASALNMLGTHPDTYMHLATKLVTHFVSDTPSSADIQTVYQAFANSGGSLPAAHAALVGLQNAWVPLQKLRTPADLVVAVLRASGATAASIPAHLPPDLTYLGQPIWGPPFPNGWSDLAADWTSPGSMVLRADWVGAYAQHISGITPAQAIAASVGPFLSSRTANLLSGIKSPQEQFTLLFCSSEFQRR